MRTFALARLARTALLVAAALAVLVPTLRADHKDARLGFAIQTPRDWNAIPQKADETWLVANYQSKKAFFFTEKGGWTEDHKPNMQVIAFVGDQIKEMAKVEKRKDKKGNTNLLVSFDSPYKDYKDYMARRYTGGGWYVDKEEKTKVGDIEATVIEIRVDKLSYQGPKRIVTWIYHVPDVDVAVQFEVLQDGWPKIQAEVTRILKSFKLIPRSGEALVSEVVTGKKLTILEADELTPEERKGWRQSEEQGFHARAQKNLPAGWDSIQVGRFLVVFSCDEKYARKVGVQAEAVWEWLETTFPFVGEKEYVRAPVIRICKDQDEYMQFHKGGGWSWNNLEIVTFQDHGGSDSYRLGDVNQGVLNVWFGDRDRELYWAMPDWLSGGLIQVIAQARVDKGKVEFRRDDWNREDVRTMVRERRAKRPREIMMMTDTQIRSSSNNNFWDVHFQTQAFVTFLVAGPASRNAKSKTFLQQYVKSLKEVQLAVKAAEKAKGGDKAKKPANEEEEAKMFRAQADNYKAQESNILDQAFRKAFGTWTEKDWDQFEDVYFQTIG